jgi:hypothetical protein
MVFRLDCFAVLHCVGGFSIFAQMVLR